jgi:hypothetical protein
MATVPSRLPRARQRYLDSASLTDPRLADHPDLQDARRAVARLALYLSYLDESLRAGLLPDPAAALPARRGEIRDEVHTLTTLIASADALLGPARNGSVRVELEDARGQIPSTPGAVIESAKAFARDLERMLRDDGWVDRVNLLQRLGTQAMENEEFANGITDALFHWPKAAGIDFEFRQAALRRERRAPNREDGFRHSSDFATVTWRGMTFRFTPTQRAVVRLLYEALVNGTPGVGEQTILEEIGSRGKRVRDLFRTKTRLHSAWGKLIVPEAGAKGVLRLAPDC